MVTEEEVENAIFSMSPNKSFGPDGFPARFYQKCWHIVGKDITNAISEFFRRSKLLKSWNTTFLALLPKTLGANELKKFRLISLCNYVYKIITKILTKRLQKYLALLISPEQDGFVKGRQITDSIIAMHETINSLHSRKEEGMLLKLDMQKAYDRVNWKVF